MATLVQPPVTSEPTLPRKKWTREEVNHMLRLGMLEGQRIELIDGELIDKMGQGPRHSNAIRRLMALLIRVFGIERVSVQAPIEAGPRDQKWSQPEPDLAVLNYPWQFAPRHPGGNELSLAIEVADTSLRQDSFRKRDMYAHAGVPEYWVLDIDSRRLFVFRQLNNDAYTEALTLAETDAVPHLNVPVAELLG
ncbi:MAG: Uma2 family endonuclease [Bryobacteraceae bacterium]